MAQNIMRLVHRAMDDAGAIEPNATLEVFVAGSSTPVTLYSDRGLTTSAGSSITAAADGVFPERWIADGVLVKLVYKDADGAIKHTRDYANDDGDADEEETSVLAYGVVGDGITDDYTALVAAIADALSRDVWLDFGADIGKVVKFNTPIVLTLTAGQRLKWKNGVVDGSGCATSSTLITVDGDAIGPAISLSSNASYGDHTVAVSGSPTIAADELYILRSTAAYDGEGTAKRSEWGEVASFSDPTVTLKASIIGLSYTTGASAQLRKFETDRSFQTRGTFKIIGGGTAKAHAGILLRELYEPLIDSVIEVEDCAVAGWSFDACVRPLVTKRAKGKNFDNAGEGYMVEFAGCEAGSMLQGAEGRNGRKVVEITSSYTATHNLVGRHTRIGHCEGSEMLAECVNPKYGTADSYIEGFACRMKQGSTNEAMVVEGARVHIGAVTLESCQTTAIGLSTFGHSDGPPNFVKIGSASYDVDGTPGSFTLFLENRASHDNRRVTFELGPVTGYTEYGARVSPTEGDVYVDAPNLDIEASKTAFYATSTAAYRVFGRIGGRLQDKSSSASYYAVFLDGSVYEAANAGNPGVILDYVGGDIIKDGASGSCIRVDDALLTLGANVRPTGGASVISENGVGSVDRQVYAKQVGGSTASPGYVYKTRQVFTSDGTYTRPSGCKAILLRGCGAGAGGRSVTAAGGQTNLGAGGGAGTYAEKWIPNPDASYAVQVGVGGAADTGGEDTTFGSVLTCPGGNTTTQETGSGTTIQRSGAGGAISSGATGEDFEVLGGEGGIAIRLSGSLGISGRGGASFFGAGGEGVAESAATGRAGTAPGAGGSGGGSNDASANPGGPGEDGILIVEEYY